MTENIVEFPDRNAIEQEAGEWLIKLDGDQSPSAQELEALREWLERSPVHREQLTALAEFWGKLNVLTDLTVPLGNAETRTPRGLARRQGPAVPSFLRAGLIAAVLIVGTGLASMYLFRPDPILSSNGLYATVVGQQQSTTLADGSVVLLNTNTQIRVNYDNEYRNIRLLQGEAHFTVVKNPARPFRVYAGDGRVQAVGTAFSVYLRDDTVDVTVTEGKVALASTNSATTGKKLQPASSGSVAVIDSDLVDSLGTIEAGESASIHSALSREAAGAVEIVEPVKAKAMVNRLSWREGMLTFSGDPLGEVVDEISRYTTVSIEFTDPAVRATRIGGQFPIGEVDAMLDTLEANFGLHVTRPSHDRVVISAVDK